MLWGAILLACFGLLRRSNVLCSPATFNPSTSLCRRDVVFYEWGILVLIRHTKTIQHREYCLKIPLPRMPGYRLCPVQAIYHAFHLTSLAPADGLAFVIPVKNCFKPLALALFVTHLRRLLFYTEVSVSVAVTH